MADRINTNISQHVDHDSVLLTSDKLSTEQAQQAVVTPQAGGVSLFVGTTRDNFQGKRVTCLEYEAYESMAVQQMRRLCESARKKWPTLLKICVMHRLGTVPIGEASVIIAVSSAHRREAIDACSYLIDDLKATVPIWKKEQYEDGSMWKVNPEAFSTLKI